MSRIGKKPVEIPAKVKVAVSGSHVAVEGPKGKLAWDVPAPITVAVADNKVNVQNPDGETRQSKSLHGLSRSLIANMISGVSEGYSKRLQIQGIGFKAAVKGQKLELELGFSHTIFYDIPPQIKVTVAENVNLTIEGPDKQVVGQVAAEIRSYHPPEPYKGKGVRYLEEQVRRKEGKTVAGGSGGGGGK
ncbi:MAG: 50S ribosomal protein L6 [Verrucomicrobiae bacterium]|nr:50S ribosomal protein L6 [Verrucomicrobiae bacterium]